MAYRYYQDQRPEGTSQSWSSHQMAPSSASSNLRPTSDYYSSHPSQAPRQVHMATARDPAQATTAHPGEYTGSQHAAGQPNTPSQLTHAASPSTGHTQPGRKSKYSIVKSGWGTMHNFMDSYNIKHDPEGYQEASLILAEFQKYDEEEPRAEQAEAETAGPGARDLYGERSGEPDVTGSDSHNGSAREGDAVTSNTDHARASDYVLQYDISGVGSGTYPTPASGPSSYFHSGPSTANYDYDQEHCYDQGHSDYDEGGGEDRYGYDGDNGDDDGYDDGGYDDGDYDDGGYEDDENYGDDYYYE
ncbi:hypothetical protein F5X99DRAFT_429050, partial [Biscogniauxia marginata]